MERIQRRICYHCLLLVPRRSSCHGCKDQYANSLSPAGSSDNATEISHTSHYPSTTFHPAMPPAPKPAETFHVDVRPAFLHLERLPAVDDIWSLPLPTLEHIPCAARVKWAALLISLLELCVQEPSVQHFTLLFLAPKCILGAPNRGGRNHF